jgi:hypothetical protein
MSILLHLGICCLEMITMSRFTFGKLVLLVSCLFGSIYVMRKYLKLLGSIMKANKMVHIWPGFAKGTSLSSILISLILISKNLAFLSGPR